MHNFIPPSTRTTKLNAAELGLVYHGVYHVDSYIGQSCTIDLVRKMNNKVEKTGKLCYFL
jgi:hypothetical protein